MLHLKVANLEVTNTLVQRGVALNKANVDCDTQFQLAE
jgi:hypothetical protein